MLADRLTEIEETLVEVGSGRKEGKEDLDPGRMDEHLTQGMPLGFYTSLHQAGIFMPEVIVIPVTGARHTINRCVDTSRWAM